MKTLSKVALIVLAAGVAAGCQPYDRGYYGAGYGYGYGNGYGYGYGTSGRPYYDGRRYDDRDYDDRYRYRRY